jgi:hypothetical protein
MNKLDKEEEAKLKEQIKRKKENIMSHLDLLKDDNIDSSYFSKEWLKKKYIKKANN